jgi:hypothetical protein
MWEEGFTRRKFFAKNFLLALGAAKCSSAFVDARCVVFLLKVNLLCSHPFESLFIFKYKRKTGIL